VSRGLTAALRAHSAFHQLLAAGLAALIGLQALLIVGGVIRVIPLTGVTLPFLSYGGSSLVVSFIMVGLLLRLSAEGAATRGR
jgi:cell division protein FtsW (lipid II flippase)